MPSAIRRPRREDCAFWPAIASQIARSGYFPFAFQPDLGKAADGLLESAHNVRE